MIKKELWQNGFFELSWKISEKCNYNCPYCVVHKKEEEVPNYYEIAERINELFNLIRPDNGQLYITGGEPFLWPLDEIMRKFTSPFLKKVRITSNMSLPEADYLTVRTALEDKGKSFILRGSFHLEKAPKEQQTNFFHKCALAKCDTVNIVCNDENYADYLILLSEFNFDGNKTIYVDGREMTINWMVERKSGGGISDKVKAIPRRSRTFAISSDGCKCSAGQSSLRVEPNGDIKRCASTEAIGNIFSSNLEDFVNMPIYHCYRKTCPGCYNIFVYDDSSISFFHNKKEAEKCE